MDLETDADTDPDSDTEKLVGGKFCNLQFAFCIGAGGGMFPPSGISAHEARK